MRAFIDNNDTFFDLTLADGGTLFLGQNKDNLPRSDDTLIQLDRGYGSGPCRMVSLWLSTAEREALTKRLGAS